MVHPGAAADVAVSQGQRAAGFVVVLSYAYAEADRVRDTLADGADLACTTATGILPQCMTVAEVWQQVEGRARPVMSPLTAATIRTLVSAQVTVILAAEGKRRWCELAAISPAAETFLQVFPDTAFVCVHRGCLDLIRAGLRASPWGLQAPALMPYLVPYSGNSVAALAAYWADSAGRLLAFEQEHREAARRVRYEDVAGQQDQVVAATREWLRLDSPRASGALAGRAEFDPAATSPGSAEPEVPADLIPQPLRDRIARLNDQLGYPPLAG
jgi:hypothetical protein